MHIPGEIVLDPWLYPIALASHARENGAKIFTSFPFDPASSTFDHETKLWTIPKPNTNSDSNDGDDNNNNNNNNANPAILSKSIINAAGIQSDLIHLQTKDIPEPSWEAKPRRGQYRIFARKEPHLLNTNTPSSLQHPIQPVPTQRTKGIFVFSSLYNQIIVGPTALDQESRTDIAPDDKVALELTKHARRILSASVEHDNNDDDKNKNTRNEEKESKRNDNKDNDITSSYQYVGEYVGIRPGTNHRDYQIHFLPEKRWISAAGIRSTGLTASLGIGSYVTNLLQTVVPTPSSSSTCLDTHKKKKLTPLPDIEILADMYRNSKDGFVDVNGYTYKVTHPVTKLGWTYSKK